MSPSRPSLIEPTSATLARLPQQFRVEVCPTCDQPIPHDHFDEIKARIETREQERSAEIKARLDEQFAREKAQVRQEAAVALDRVKQEAAEKVAAARDEGRQAAEAAAQEQLAAAERMNQEALAALQARIEQAEVAKASSDETRSALQAQLDQMRRDSETAIEKVKQDAAAKEADIRAEAARTADAAVQEKLAGIERARQESEAALQTRIEEAEAAKTAAQEASSALQAQLGQMQRDNAAAIEKVKQDAVLQESEIRREAGAAAEAAMQEKISGIEQAKADAEARYAAAEQQVRALQETHKTQLSQRLQEQRDALEQAKTEAVNAEKSAAFEEKIRLSAKVEDLQRALDKKTAEDLGEGAELDLFEALKSEFEGDRIERVNKGQPGADILHTIMHNGKECGKIIYDSKNHNAWRNDFVTKLTTDKMAAKAEHAILSTRKFPACTRHLHVQDGVILASPARVVALVQIVRQHLVQTHTLRLSNEAQAQKTEALYSFITSERCKDLFGRIDTQAEKLLEMQVKEKKAHEDVWKRQGEMLRSIQKVRAELCNEIDTIIETVEAPETAP